MPRLSVDLDLVFRDHTLPRERALEQITAALRQSVERLKSQGFQHPQVPQWTRAKQSSWFRRGNIEVKLKSTS